MAETTETLLGVATPSTADDDEEPPPPPPLHAVNASTATINTTRRHAIATYLLMKTSALYRRVIVRLTGEKQESCLRRCIDKALAVEMESKGRE